MIAALHAVALDVVVIGNAAAAMQGAPVMTQNIDLFLRDTKRNREKIAALARTLGGTCAQPFLPASEMFRIQTPDLLIDCMLKLSAHQKFETVKSRALKIRVGKGALAVAALADVIAQKEAAGRPKDLAVLAILRATLAVKQRTE